MPAPTNESPIVLVGGHSVTPLVDGEAIFGALYDDMRRARRRIYVAMWGVSLDFILRRGPEGDVTLAAFCRDALASHADLEIFLLAWDWGRWALEDLPEQPLGLAWATPEVLRAMWDRIALAPDPDDYARPRDRARLHVRLHANPVMGSHHQKFVICDLPPSGGDGAGSDAALHCLGVNFLNTYWDDALHAAPVRFDEAVSGPRHDTGARIQGPVVRDFEAEFARRWADADGDGPGTLDPSFFAHSARGRSEVAALFHTEQTASPSPIRDWYLERIAGAREYVYIEDLYFSDASVAEALCRRYLESEAAGEPVPMALVLPWYESLWPIPAAEPLSWWTLFNATRLRVRTARRFKVRGTDEPYVRPRGGWAAVRMPLDPTAFLSLVAADADVAQSSAGAFEVETPQGTVAWRDIEWIEEGIAIYRMLAASCRWPAQKVYVHSKLALVDDEYTVGSSNIAKQSFVLDSEANIAVRGRREVRDVWSALWPPLVAPDLGVPDAPRDWLATFARTAAANDAGRAAFARGEPSGAPSGLLCGWQPLEY